MTGTVESIATAFPANPQVKMEKQESGRLAIFQEFCLNTSAHALPGVARSQSIHNRLFWLFSFFIFTGIMIYFIVTAILAYYSYPTNIEINIVGEWPQYFPAVSICNFSPIRLDTYSAPFLNFTRARNLTSPNATTDSAYNLVNVAKFIRYNLNENNSVDHYFYSLKSMLYSCTFNSQPCSADDFTSFLSSSFGMCYTFNAKPKDNQNRTLRHANQYAGSGVLELAFYIHSHQNVPNINNAHGMVALLHDNTQLPLIEKSGIELAPGRSHKLGYRKKTNYFLPSPYTRCTDKISPMMTAMINNYNGADYQYSESICFELCGQVYAYEQCGCVNPYSWNGRSILKPGTDQLIVAPICDITDSCYSKAMQELISPMLADKYCSECSSQCSIINFVVQASSLLAPASWELEKLKAFVENTSVPVTSNWTTTWKEDIKNNYVAVKIIRETNVVENSTQSPTIQLVDVLSNIGGQTGLWIGISLLSIMEFVEMLYRLIRHEFYGLRRLLC